MRTLVLSALAVLFGVGCAAGGDQAAGNVGIAGSTSAGGDHGATSDLPSSLEFEMKVASVFARDQLTLNVRALPAQVYPVRFALPTSGGDPRDAVLDRSEADTDQNGFASVQLTAPSASATFEVRASVKNSVTTSVVITATDPGLATVLVQPRYATALRDITTWIATAHPNKTCAEVPGIPPPDGPLQASPASKAQAPLISGVPADTPLAITLRSGHFVGGCASVAGLPSGPPSSPQVVQVSVLNRPIDLSASSLSFSLSLAASDTTWSTSLVAAGDAVLAALGGSGVDDVDALLSAMRDASGSARQMFESTRKIDNWDALLRAHWGASAATKLHDTVTIWLAAGRQNFASSQHLLEGALIPVQQAGALAQTRAQLTLTSVAGLDATRAGFVSPASVSWSASPDDNVVMGTDLYLISSQLAAALAEAFALQKATKASAASEALAAALDCAGTANILASAGASAPFAYADCDAACLNNLCHAALAAIWLRGEAATALTPTRLSITATGSAYVGDAAAVAGMGGNWLGELKAPTGSKPTGGTLTALQAP
jgi:hypothetical protein